MESYNAPNHSYGTHGYRITLMFEKYSGHIESFIGGNVRGSRILEHAIEFIEDGYGKFSSDCDFTFDEDDENFCSFTLHDKDGNEMEFEDCEVSEVEDLIVAVEITSFTPKEL